MVIILFCPILFYFICSFYVIDFKITKESILFYLTILSGTPNNKGDRKFYYFNTMVADLESDQLTVDASPFEDLAVPENVLLN